MLKAVLFDEFSYQCQFFNSDDEKTNGYGCNHPKQNGEGCYCCCCPLGIVAEQQDLTDKNDPDAIQDEIDWDGMCGDGKVAEGEYLLVRTGKAATAEEKQALCNYDRYMHRYDKKWLDEHGIENCLCG